METLPISKPTFLGKPLVAVWRGGKGGGREGDGHRPEVLPPEAIQVDDIILVEAGDAKVLRLQQELLSSAELWPHQGRLERTLIGVPATDKH